MLPAGIQHFLVLGQAGAAGFTARQVLAYFNDLGDRETLADRVE